jgi:protein neuralized
VIDGPPPWERRLQQPDLTSSLPPVSSLQRDHGDTVCSTPPPRPPPPRSSPAASSTVSARALPSLPPKQHKSVSLRSSLDSPARDQPLQLIQTPCFVAATAFPAPPSQPVATMPHHHHRTAVSSLSLPHPRSRNGHSKMAGVMALTGPRPQSNSAANVGDRSEVADNASNECSVCLEKPSDCVLYTCGHMCMCYDCAINVQRTDGASCPICRQPIRDVIKIFRA